MKFINVVLTVMIVILWVSILFIHGMIGVTSWILVKLILAPIGVVGIIIGLILCITSKKENRINKIIFTGLMVVLAMPILLLFNVVPMEYPVLTENISLSITIESPFKEDVLIGWGGNSIKENAPHVIWPSERFAYDIVKTPYETNSPLLEAYGIYDMAVYAPVAGTVVAVKDNEDDIIPNSEEFLSMEGNYVYIRIESTGTYLLMNHLKKDSVGVKSGDYVEVGDYLATIGNSGSTSEPHLHIHHQKQDPTKTVHPILAEGLPLYFYDENKQPCIPIKNEVLKTGNKKDQ